MKPNKTYLKGQSVFIVSLLVIGITILTVYLTGVNYHRTLTSNLYLSLSIIGVALFLFMTYGLYKGIGLDDNFPKFRTFKTGDYIPISGELPDIDIPNLPSSDGISGLIISILVWIGVTLLFFVLLILLEAVFWISIFIILMMLYWIFFRALRLVFSKSITTKGDFGMATLYSFMHTVLYVGWIYGIAFLITTLG